MDYKAYKSEPNQPQPGVAAAAEAEIVLPGRGLQYPGHIAELKVEGCLIQTKCKLEPGTLVEVWLRTDSMPLRVAASLVERQESGVRFRFQPMPARKAQQIEDLRMELGLA